MISHHEEERENDMKKRLNIALAICVLILSACGAVPGTTPASNRPTSQPTAETQAACHIFQDQQVQLQQAIHAARVQLSTAHGDLRKAEKAKNTLIRLHEPSVLVQAELRACPSAG